MFNRNNGMAKTNENTSASINLIGTGTNIKGDINCDGDIRIDGSVNGSVVSKGKVVVGPTGKVDGEITCQNADISGSLNGNISVAELLILKSTANLKGDITTNKLSVEPGANFSGVCSMGGVVKGLKNSDRIAAEKTA
jgi:cytoskeletal protein CcmA (bactofilin family)